MNQESIFKRLYKKKDIFDDFVTEAFAGVLRSLNDRELDSFFRELKVPGIEFSAPFISTQKVTAAGINDLVIEDENTVMIFENKWDAGTDIKQLHNYDNYLNQIEKQEKYLIHVTKHYKPIKEDFSSLFFKRNWSDVYSGLNAVSSTYIIEEFLKFLKEEGVVMDKVSWEIINGSKSIFFLTRIIERACEELKVPHKWDSGESSLECYISQKIANNVISYFLIKEGKLYFSVYGLDKPPFEEMTESYFNTDDYGLYFDFDKYGFFHKTLEEEVHVMKEFIANLLQKIK